MQIAMPAGYFTHDSSRYQVGEQLQDKAILQDKAFAFGILSQILQASNKMQAYCFQNYYTSNLSDEAILIKLVNSFQLKLRNLHDQIISALNQSERNQNNRVLQHHSYAKSSPNFIQAHPQDSNLVEQSQNPLTKDQLSQCIQANSSTFKEILALTKQLLEIFETLFQRGIEVYFNQEHSRQKKAKIKASGA